MVSLWLRPLRQLAQALIAEDSTRQIAWGVVLGMLIGLLPKGNLTAVALAVMLCGLRVNKPAGLMAAGIFSLIGMTLDGFAHRIGALVLTWQPAQSAYVWLYELPLGPWIGFNNTVVLGQLLIGLYLIYPTYWFSQAIAARLQPRLRQWVERTRAIRVLRGVELGTSWRG